jgi:signal transduction histidine kinase
LPQEEIKKVFLDLKDLQRVVDYIPLTLAMDQIKDLFLFQCYTADSDGSGLGLYIAKEAVQKMNGNITVDSIYGKGSIFMIHLSLN